MKIVPVLDLMNGQVVHGVKGQRDLYQPVQSILCSGSAPLEVARSLQAETGCDAIYIADLDAIRETGDNLASIREIASNLSVELWVDAGVTDPDSAKRLLSAGADVAVVGSETLPDLLRLRRIRESVSPEKVLFSLDITGGTVISRAGALKDLEPPIALERLVRESLKRFIILTLDAVGAGGGPDLEVLTRAKQDFPGCEFIAGGGVKTPGDLGALSQARISGALIATSLHRGWIRGSDISALGSV